MIKLNTLSLILFISSTLAQSSVAQTNHAVNSLSQLEVEQSSLVPLDTDTDNIRDSHDQCPNTPKGNKVNQYGCSEYERAKVEKVPSKQTAQEIMTVKLLINFDNDKFNIKAQYLDEIERVATFLNKYPLYSIVISGHTSSQGDAEYNKNLSRLRATEITKTLINDFIIDETRVFAVGYGEEQLIELDDTNQAHRINRRVEGIVMLVKESIN